MPRKPSKTIEEQKYELRMKIAEHNEQYQTALYFETMPKVNPNYSYSYQHSNLSIAWEDHSVDAWLRAVIKHMKLRKPGHGGQGTDALLITMFKGLPVKQEDMWIDYVTRKLRKYNKVRVKKS